MNSSESSNPSATSLKPPALTFHRFPRQCRGNRQSGNPFRLRLITYYARPCHHVIELIRVEDPGSELSTKTGVSRGIGPFRQLQRQIGSLLFEADRAVQSQRPAVISWARREEPPADVTDLLRNPDILNSPDSASGRNTPKATWKGPCSITGSNSSWNLALVSALKAAKKRITVGKLDDYIDLGVHHRRLRCHVLVELKTCLFTHGDAGQMNFDPNWWKAHGMDKGDELPVGILLCSDQDRTKVEFATVGMNNKMFVSRYLVALPSQKQLREFVERDRAHIEARMPEGPILMIRRFSSRRQKLAAGEGVTVRADPRLARDPVTSRTGSPWVTLVRIPGRQAD